jgi:hypothetical protein
MHVPDTMERWFPVVCLAALWMGAAVFKIKGARLRSVDGAKSEASGKFAYGLAVWAVLPFVSLTIGSMLGQATAQDLFRPRSNLWGLGSMVGTLTLYARRRLWLYWEGGPDFVVKHANLVGLRTEWPPLVKFVLTLMMAAGLAAMTIAWFRES